MAEVKFSINGQPNTPNLPLAVELMWNHLLSGSFKKAAGIGSTMTDICRDLARELWEAERRMPDSRPDIPVCPF